MSMRNGADDAGTDQDRARIRPLRLLAAVVLVNGALLAPWWILRGGVDPPWVALEAVVVVGLFAVLPSRAWVWWAAGSVAALVVVFTVVGLADTTLRLSLGRPLNLYIDLWLVSSVWDLTVGTFGPIAAAAAVVALPAVLVLLVILIARLLLTVRVDREILPVRAGAAGVAALLSVGLALELTPGVSVIVDAPTARIVRDQGRRLSATVQERAWFAAKLADTPDSYADLPGLLAGLRDRDVVLGFIESYGVVAIDHPDYRRVVGPRLDDFERRMEAAGLHVASGRLVAPSQGGQSWFGHASVLTGVWLDNQLRYDMMLATGRETLIDDFRRIGHRTVAVMPAITTAWPEGRRLGYDEVFSFDDIDYAGPPLNWVTMPDQFTWSFFENRVRASDERPVFAEIGLISSHAPWTPILPVLDDWDAIGDGSVFERFAGTGVPPGELWRDGERVREHYALSVEYALHATIAYAERYADDRMLLIVLGDHQPAPLITGEDATWDVPVHVVSGDPALVQPFLDWGFSKGAWPEVDPGRTTLGVDYFRDWFVRAYSGG